jgi:hypothetical protein
MDASLGVVRRHREAALCTLLDEQNKIAAQVLDELGSCRLLGPAGRREYGGSGAVRAFAPFLTKMAMVDPTIAGLASVHGCIGAVDPVRTFGTRRAEAAVPAEAGQRRAAVGVRAHRAVRRFRPDGAAHAGRARRRRLRRQRRKAVHHQRRAGRTIGLVCLIDDKPAVLIVDLPDEGERALPAQEVRPVRAQAHLQPRHRLRTSACRPKTC